jgi:hypothetical protein
VDDGVVQYSVFEYSAGWAPDYYIAGLDVHTGRNWLVQNNVFRGFRLPAGSGQPVAHPVVLVWNGSEQTNVVGNTFLNNDRDISLGLYQASQDNASRPDHSGGRIEGNMISRDAATRGDVAIYVTGPGTKVYHNSYYDASGAYPSAIEYRFAGTNVDVKNNLLSRDIRSRDGATASLGGNLTAAPGSWFANPAAGDLHLTAAATAAINAGVAVTGLLPDYDGQGRPAGPAPDVGADEVNASNPPADTTPPTVAVTGPANGAAASGTVTVAASASDNVGVAGVQFLVNGLPLGAEDTAAPYSASWNTTAVANGSYTLSARARDAAGNLTTSGGVTVTVSNTASSDPLNKPVLSSSSFAYLGSFRVPAEANGWTTGSTMGGLAHRYVNGQLRFFSTNTVNSGGQLYEFSYPGHSVAAPPQAQLVRGWGDPYDGRRWVGNGGGSTSLYSGAWTYGLHYDPDRGRLYWSYGYNYNASHPFNPSLGYSVLDEASGAATGVGAWSLASRPEKFTRGGVTRIPQWFADRFTGGRTLGVGFGGYFSATQTASMGPALAAAADPEPGANPDRSALANVPLLGYPFSPAQDGSTDRAHRDADYSSSYDFGDWNPSGGVGYWTHSDVIYGGGAWIDTPTAQGVLFVAKVGQGRVWYETSERHAERGAFAWLVYDPKDLAAVATGAKQQWQVQPKHYWLGGGLPGTPGYDGDGAQVVGGVTYDATAGRLYVLVTSVWSAGGAEAYPQVYVYQVGALLEAAAAAPPPAASPAVASGLTAAQAQPLLAAALARWGAAGADTSGLGDVALYVADLPGAALGLASGRAIWLDRDAAGWGWFMDPTPRGDGEFTTPGDQGEAGRMDLLSVLAHELGHVLGHADGAEHADGVMGAALRPGVRRVPAAAERGATPGRRAEVGLAGLWPAGPRRRSGLLADWLADAPDDPAL